MNRVNFELHVRLAPVDASMVRPGRAYIDKL